MITQQDRANRGHEIIDLPTAAQAPKVYKPLTHFVPYCEAHSREPMNFAGKCRGGLWREWEVARRQGCRLAPAMRSEHLQPPTSCLVGMPWLPAGRGIGVCGWGMRRVSGNDSHHPPVLC